MILNTSNSPWAGGKGQGHVWGKFDIWFFGKVTLTAFEWYRIRCLDRQRLAVLGVFFKNDWIFRIPYLENYSSYEAAFVRIRITGLDLLLWVNILLTVRLMKMAKNRFLWFLHKKWLNFYLQNQKSERHDWPLIWTAIPNFYCFFII